MKCFIFTILLIASAASRPVRTGDRIDGYRGIWFELNQKSQYGDKYSGGLGAYTAKHHPLAVYSELADKTFFVYGGTPSPDSKQLLAMLSYYDHKTGRVPKPVVVHAKPEVIDPHDNPSLQIDAEGYLWIFVSGRAAIRPGYIYKSAEPFTIDSLIRVREAEFAYPQPIVHGEDGFLLLFTKYTNGRELYWATSLDGMSWSDDQKLATKGHYQMTNQRNRKVITAFNAHPNGVDTRTNLYFLQTLDMGKTWTTVEGTPVKTPVTGMQNPALIRDYQREGRLVYLKDINFDRDGNPVLLYITSANHAPGPAGDPRIWTIAHWTGKEWQYHEITHSTHNYDMGSLYIEDDGAWRVIGPTEPGPQPWGAGGEMAAWLSRDQGASWKKVRDLTQNSRGNHCYARRPVNAHPKFYAFWADGHAHEFSESFLYFTNKAGNYVYKLPYEMTTKYAHPEKLSGESSIHH